MNNTLKNKILAAAIEVKILEARHDELKMFKNMTINTTTINNRLTALKNQTDSAKRKLENLRNFGVEETVSPKTIVIELSIPAERFNKTRNMSSEELIQYLKTEKLELI